jgi:hypothetical protein
MQFSLSGNDSGMKCAYTDSRQQILTKQVLVLITEANLKGGEGGKKSPSAVDGGN